MPRIQRRLRQQHRHPRAAQPGGGRGNCQPGIGHGQQRFVLDPQSPTSVARPADPRCVRRGTGRGHGHPPALAQRHAFEIGRPLAKAHREIEVGLGEIGLGVAADQHVAQLRIDRAERGEARGEPQAEHVARGGDGIDVARLARLHRPHRFLELEEPAAQGIEPGHRLVGQLQPLGGAPEQHYPEHVLERADLLADRRRRHRQLIRRARERQMPRRRIEYAQAVERKVGALHARWLVRGAGLGKGCR